MREHFMLDLPGFIASSLRVGEKAVCAISPKAAEDASVQEVARELLHREGVDCSACRACPVGAGRVGTAV